MTQFHKRGLFDILKDTLIFYKIDFKSSGGFVYQATNGYVKNGVVYTTKKISGTGFKSIPLRFEEEFSNFTKDDYDKLGVDYIAVYDCPHLDYNDNCSIVSYRRYDGVYHPTAQKYISLFVKI